MALPGARSRAIDNALEASNREGIGEYLARKAPFIDAIVG